MAPRTHTRDNHRRNPVNAFLSNLHENRSAKTGLIDATLNRAADEARDITDIELANIQALKLEIEKLDERIEQITDLEVRKAKAAELAASVDGGAIESRAAAPARVISEEPTYHERSSNDFLADAIAAEFGGSYEARERISRYQRESMEKRDSGSANFAGLVIPQYLVSEFAGIRRPGRPVLDISTNAALPAQGMTVNIGRLTTGITSYVQASENTAPTESDPDDTLLTVNVNTVASMFDISKQAVLRGTGVETQLLGDAVRSYQSRLDGLAISGSGSSGQHRGILNTSGINATTYTDASPTWAEFFPKLVEAIQNISSNFYGGATHIVAHPSLIGCWLRALDSTNRPLFNATAGNPFNAPGTFDRPAYDMVASRSSASPLSPTRTYRPTSEQAPTRPRSSSETSASPTSGKIMAARRCSFVSSSQTATLLSALLCSDSRHTPPASTRPRFRQSPAPASSRLTGPKKSPTSGAAHIGPA